MTPRELAPAERAAWIRLARTRRIGPVTFFQLIQRYETAVKALEALPALAARAGGKAPSPPSADALAREVGASEALGGRVLCTPEPGYPRYLRTLSPPPPVISLLGQPALVQKRAVAIVGSRNASAIGMRFAQDIANGVGAEGFTIVSGLARGIDGAAHRGSLGSGTAAVVAGGVDYVYPPENADLRDAITERGALLSERPLGLRATARDFPRRNRLIAGLALGVVVIEAAQKSGSLITARYAGEMGRDVMAAPGSPLDPRARGSNGLIRDGAALIESVEDVLDVVRATPLVTAVEEPTAPYDAGPELDETSALDAAEEARDAVLRLLSPSPVHVDELARQSSLPIAAVNAAVLELTLAGQAQQLPGGLAARAPIDNTL